MFGYALQVPCLYNIAELRLELFFALTESMENSVK